MYNEHHKPLKKDTIPLFLSFCIEQYKNAKNLDGQHAMQKLSDLGVLNYLRDNYEILHTQSPQWINEEIDNFINNQMI